MAGSACSMSFQGLSLNFDLHQYHDRSTLLATALVCKDWCMWSQRIIFSVVADGWHDNRERVMRTHMLFLQAIVESPRRRGPLVHSYAKDSLSYSPAAGMRKPVMTSQRTVTHRSTEQPSSYHQSTISSYSSLGKSKAAVMVKRD